MTGNHPSNTIWVKKKKKMLENKMNKGQLSLVSLQAERPRFISVNFVTVGLEKVGVTEVKLQ